MPALDHVRSQSLFGLSDIKCYFTWAITYRDARQEVINRLQFVQLPTPMQPSLSPWNAIGEVFRYRIVGKGYTTRDLKTAEDWVLERQFKQVPGVIDVVSFGGETKQYHVGVDPFRMRGQGVRLEQLMHAIQTANTNVGGQRLVIGEQAYAVRGVGLLRDVARHRGRGHRRTPRRARASEGRRDDGGRRRSAPRNRRSRRRRRHRSGRRAHALRRRDGEHAQGDSRARRLHPPQQRPAAGDAARALLRPRQSRDPHDAHRVREPVRRHDARLGRSLPLPRSRPRGPRHGREHPHRASRGVQRDGHHRDQREPDLARGDRLRHRRRLDRHHDGEHLPSPRPARTGHDDRPHPGRGARGGHADGVRGDHHRGGVHPAVHDDRGRRGHLRAARDDVRVRDRRRDADGPDAYAGARVQADTGAAPRRRTPW